MTRLIHLVLIVFPGAALAQFPSPNGPWGQGPAGHGRPTGGKPMRPVPYSRPVPSYGKPIIPPAPQGMSDDPIPPNPALDNSYESQQLPSRLPLMAPNGVVEIYNRVVDDLIHKLEGSFKKREIDPMNVVIRPTPTTPVRVPGHLQKRPFRRPGAPLYRSTLPATPVRMKNARANPLPEEPVSQLDTEKPSFRGVGKISKASLGEETVDTVPETTPVAIVVVTAESTAAEVTSTTPKVVVPANHESMESSEEPNLFRGRSEEYFPEDEDAEDVEANKPPTKGTKSRSSIAEKVTKKATKNEESEEDEDDLKAVEEGKKDVDTLLQRYQNKNVNEVKEKGKNKYTAVGSKKKVGENSTHKKKIEDLKKKEEVDEEIQEDEDDDEDVQDDLDEMSSHGGNHFYPGGGPMQLKPNAQLTGLSKIKRASDVSVSVDARSAIITARLLVGPLNININDSIEPMERNVRAKIPELEAEMILMERHGVVFLQRFTLDRAYGQDVEISMPKNKSDAKKKKTPVIPGLSPPPGMDPNQVQQRFQTKMAAHISMEVVKLLRSGNLRVNMMRTAQGSMSKLKLPIKSNKTSKKKGTKSESKNNSKN